MPPFRIHLRPSAVTDLDGLQKAKAVEVADAMERYLSNEPTKVGKSRIKRLRGVSNPDFRLRVGDHRVFYVVDEDAPVVEVLRVRSKEETEAYYKEIGHEGRPDG